MISLTNPSQGNREARDDPHSRLMRRVGQLRDREAFAELYKHFAPLIKGFCLGNLNSNFHADAAEEIVQEAMFKVWQKSTLFDSTKASASTWIYTIVRNTRIDYLRRQKSSYLDQQLLSVEDIWEDLSEDSSLVYLQQMSNESLVEKSLAQLAPEQRQVITQVYMQGKTHQQIADETGIPLGTVKSRVRIGLKKIQSLVLGTDAAGASHD